MTLEMALFTTGIFQEFAKQIKPVIMQKTWCVWEDQVFSCQTVEKQR
jgi:hypothetical protein